MRVSRISGVRFGGIGALVGLVGLVTLGGCVSTNLTGSVMPGAKIEDKRLYFVEKFERDNRGIQNDIRDQLLAMGHEASSGPAGSAPEEADVLVTYQDRWMWDMSMYLLQLDIQFKDPSTGHVIATGQSYRTSLARKSPPEMAREVLGEIFGVPPAPHEKSKKAGR